MHFKKSYKKANGYTPICKIGECSLKDLEFGIIELTPGQKLEFDTENKETAFVMLWGTCAFTCLPSVTALKAARKATSVLP